jgi:hypothetical protein
MKKEMVDYLSKVSKSSLLGDISDDILDTVKSMEKVEDGGKDSAEVL